MTVCNSILQLGIINDAACDSVDQQHASRLQPALLNDTLGLDRNGAYFGSADDAIIVHYVVSTRSKSVSVEVGSAEPTIGKGEERRPIPRLHLTGSPLVERTLLGVHVSVSLPRLGHHQHDGLWERKHAVDGQKLKHVVKGCRVRSAVLDNGIELLELVSKDV